MSEVAGWVIYSLSLLFVGYAFGAKEKRTMRNQIQKIMSKFKKDKPVRHYRVLKVLPKKWGWEV